MSSLSITVSVSVSVFFQSEAAQPAPPRQHAMMAGPPAKRLKTVLDRLDPATKAPQRGPTTRADNTPVTNIALGSLYAREAEKSEVKLKQKQKTSVQIQKAGLSSGQLRGQLATSGSAR